MKRVHRLLQTEHKTALIHLEALHPIHQISVRAVTSHLEKQWWFPAEILEPIILKKKIKKINIQSLTILCAISSLCLPRYY